ncbi:hypothetical protein BJ165DRAFT_1526413 [Panaeolus papilionaceus]|nr:hypothetical protein BJ165DRAFT_1526413 [Panaeolus papilionaceus]
MSDSTIPSLSKVQEALSAVKPTASVVSRIFALAAAAELACLWKPTLDVLWLQPPVVQVIFSIRNAYHHLEKEQRDKNVDYKYPKVYHQVVELTKMIHQFRDEQKQAQLAIAPPVTPVVNTTSALALPASKVDDVPSIVADAPRPAKRPRSSRIKSKAVVDDDSDLELFTSAEKVDKVPSAPATGLDTDVVMSEASVSPNSGEGAPSSASCMGATPVKSEVKAFSSSTRSSNKRACVEDSFSNQASNAAASDLEIEVKILDIKIQGLTRSRDHLRNFIDSL